MESKKLERIAFSVLFAGISILTFFVFRPFLAIVVLAAVLAVLFHSINQELVRMFAGRKSLVACLLVLVTLIFIIIPIFFFGWQIIGQAQNFFSLTQEDQSQYLQTIQQTVNTLIQHIIPNFSFDISAAVTTISAFIADNLAGLVSQTTFIFFDTFFFLFTLFFFLRDGEKMFREAVNLSPFEKEQNKEIIASIYHTITSIMQGTVLVALIRFLLITAAFYLFGIPNALLWGSIGGIIGAIPGLGTPFVIIPAFLYVLLYNNIFSIIGMALFGTLLFFFIDNLLSAYFFGKGLDVSPFWILFALLGGIIYFGPLGFIFGPIVLSLFLSIIDMYKILILKKE